MSVYRRSIAALRSELDEFFARLPDSEDETLAAAVQREPAIADASLALLTEVFAPPSGEVTTDPSTAPHTALASIVLRHAGPQRARFLTDVALAIGNAAIYRVLAPRVAAAIPAAQLEAALIASLEGDDEVRCANALAIQYHLYGRTKGPRLSDEGRVAMARAVAALRARPGVPARVQAELDGYSLPDSA